MYYFSFTKEITKSSQHPKDFLGNLTSVDLSLLKNGAPFSNISAIQIDCFHIWKIDKSLLCIVDASNFLKRVSQTMKQTKMTAKSCRGTWLLSII